MSLEAARKLPQCCFESLYLTACSTILVMPMSGHIILWPSISSPRHRRDT